MSDHINPLTVPGVAALTFRQLQVNSRRHNVVAHLRAVQVVHGLHAVSWSVDRFGIVGTVRGGDDEITDVVWAWAEAFAVKPAVEPAYRRFDRIGGRVVPGWAVAQLVRGVTVGGRLVDPETRR